MRFSSFQIIILYARDMSFLESKFADVFEMARDSYINLIDVIKDNPSCYDHLDESNLIVRDVLDLSKNMDNLALKISEGLDAEELPEFVDEERRMNNVIKMIMPLALVVDQLVRTKSDEKMEDKKK